MATRGEGLLTYSDLHTRLNPDGTIAKVVELLSQRNTVTADIPWVQCNAEGGHMVTQRTKLGSSEYRQLNQGIDPSKGEASQIKEIYATDEDRSHIDIDQPPENCNLKEYLAGEAMPHMMQMANKFEGNIWYANAEQNPGEFTGFAPRFNKLTVNNNSRNVIDGGGDGSGNASIYIVCWGPETVHGIYPKANAKNKGMQYGITHRHFGEDDVEDSNNKKYRAYVDWFQWKHGLAIPDWRYVVRIANIKISDLADDNDDAADLNELIVTGLEHIEDVNMGEPRIYMNRTISKYLRLQSRTEVKNGGGLTFDNIGGKRVAHFDGTITRITDGLLNTEQAIT